MQEQKNSFEEIKTDTTEVSEEVKNVESISSGETVVEKERVEDDDPDAGYVTVPAGEKVPETEPYPGTELYPGTKVVDKDSQVFYGAESHQVREERVRRLKKQKVKRKVRQKNKKRNKKLMNHK